MNTHSRISDARWEIMAAHAGLQGADASEKVMESLFRSIGQHVSKRTGDGVLCGAVIFSEQYGCLGQTPEAGDILGRQEKQRRGQEW